MSDSPNIWRRLTSMVREMASSGRSLSCFPKGSSISSPRLSRPKNAVHTRKVTMGVMRPTDCTIPRGKKKH